MDRSTEIALLKEVLALKSAGSFFLDGQQTRNNADAYASADRFAVERAALFRRVPAMAAHASELNGPDSFLRRDVAGLPMLLTRDGEGQAHAFLNVCRHRGTRLVDDAAGCRKRFTCPYHAWTWNNRGDLIAVPHEAQGFPDLDRQHFGLKRVACVERYGWLWVCTDAPEALDLDGFLDGLSTDMAWLDGASLRVAATLEEERASNWKFLIEAGLEAYHFQVAHRATIAPYFHDNLSTYQMFGDHIRSVLPRASLMEMAGQPEDRWRIRDHTNLLYTIFPMNQLLVQQDHMIWIHLEPLSAGRTRLALRTLVPADDDRHDHWQRNHAITQRTLTEDFVLGESIQAGIESGANDVLTFGRFEGALGRFNASVARFVGAGATSAGRS
ncbi:MAG: SRPBCC family protein [Minwuia sp.]|nr:SRPBCC family protein [Minwuia sp.]